MAAEAPSVDDKANPYIDSSLTEAQLEYNKSANLEFEQKYGIDKKRNSGDAQKPEYEMHPFSKQIMEGNDPKLLTMIRRNKAPNPVIYRARFKNNNMRHGFDDNPVEIFWLKIAKGSIRSHRESGKKDDRVELSYIESSMAYGIKYKKVKEGEFEIKFRALPKWSCILKMCPKEGRPRLFGKLNDIDCYVHNIHVTLKEKKSWMGVPQVSHVTLDGKTVSDDEAIQHRITP